jgi:NAD(P)-dependent dehydrogenase (short-subunit alcohol dehydrogenase family)
VIVADVDEASGGRLAKEIGGCSLFYKVDVGEPQEVESMVRFAVDRFGRLDILHNNVATAGSVAPVGDMSIEAWRRAITVSLSGVFYGMRFALPRMVAHGGGVIVNAASVSGGLLSWRLQRGKGGGDKSHPHGCDSVSAKKYSCECGLSGERGHTAASPGARRGRKAAP